MDATLNNSRSYGHTVLIVDDNPTNLAVVSDCLKDSDFKILVAQDGASALEKAQYGHPDLVLLDVMMPGIDGFETCRRLKANEALRDIPVIFMTALTEVQDKVKGFEVGAVDYITKPFHHEEVLVRVTTHLRIRNLTQSLQEQNVHLQEMMARLERRTTQLQVAAEVARDATAAHKLDDLLNRAVDLIRDRFGFYYAGIFLVDERGDAPQAVLKAATGEAGRQMLEQGHKLPVGEVGIVGYVTGTGQPRIAPDVGSDPTHFRHPLLPETRSEMVLPFKVGERVIGALDVQSREQAAFDEDDVRVLQTMADQLAVALEKMRLFEQTQAALEERLQTVVSNAPILLFALDRAGVFTLAEGKGLESMGLEPADIVGELAFDLWREMPQVTQDIRRALAGERFTSIAEMSGERFTSIAETTGFVRKPLVPKPAVASTGSPAERLLFEAWWSPLRDHHGDVTGVTAVATNVTERVRAEENLRRLKEFNEDIVQNMAEGIVVIDADGHLTFVNPAQAALLGYASEELLGQHWMTIVPPDQHSIVHATNEQRTHGQVDRYELELVRKDGTRVPVLVSGSPRFEGARSTGSLIVFTDVTERVRAEKEIHRRNRELTLLNRVVAAATSMLNVEHVLQVACRELARAFGLPQAAMTMLNADGAGATIVAEYLEQGRPSGLGLTIPVTGNPAIEYVLKYRTPLVVLDAQTDELFASVHDMLRERGTVSLLVVPLMVHSEVAGAIGLETIERREFSAEEITLSQNVAAAIGQALEAAQLHQALQRHAKRLEILHEIDRAILAAQSPDAIAQAALSRLRQLVPCRWANLVLFDFESDRGIVLATHADGETGVGPETRLPLAAFYIGEELREGKTRVVEDTLTLADPPPMIQKLQAQGLRSYVSVPLIAQGQLMGSLDLGAYSPAAFEPKHVEIASEVADQLAVAVRQAQLHEQEQRHTAELARALEQQRELDRLKSEFIQNVSHELRTPLAIARGYAELLDDGELGELGSEQREPMAIVAKRLRMLSKLVDDINAVLDAETNAVQREPVDLADLAHSMLADSRTRVAVEEHGLALVVEVSPGLPPLSGDPILLGRVLDNLLSNALKFTPAGGRITVCLRQEGAGLALKVADTGIGIPADQLERIFERFYQVDGSAARRYGGTGLGLALVKEIAEAHGGRVTVESQVGQGSTFTVWLPLAEMQGADPRNRRF